MNIQTIICIVVITVMVLSYIFYKIKTNGIKEFTINMIISAEERFNKGENAEKMDYVIDKLIVALPTPLNMIVTRKMAKKFIQKVFDELKRALDYTPKKGE